MSEDDLIFCIRDPENKYDSHLIASLLKQAELQGHPMERSSYLQYLTARQIDALVHGRTDA